ncbi:unnamed protein product [Parnassius apollo]|uniref:(apollo) hypothetical protein n=1 Tax=Parnassius apollo TaxID=110799 RepID=A0A8S3WSF2_PARAO|nr:unnamed protein product [Parnassius apollo]
MDYFDFGDGLYNFEQDLLDIPVYVRPRAKIHKPRVNPLVNYDAVKFRKKYRFSNENMLKVINLVKDDIAVDTRGGGIPVHIQVMSVIRHWGRHEIHDDCGELHGVSQPTTSRFCKRVGRALASKSSELKKMPTTLAEQSCIQREFAELCRFPHVIEAIDCTALVSIL